MRCRPSMTLWSQRIGAVLFAFALLADAAAFACTRFVYHGADGRVLAQGERKLTDLAFLIGSAPLDSSDPLRFEKRMIDAWLRRELATASR